MLLLTVDRVIPVNDTIPSVYVADSVYVLLAKSEDLRRQILNSLNMESVIVERLGTEIVPGEVFEKSGKVILFDGFTPQKEVGYHGRL